MEESINNTTSKKKRIKNMLFFVGSLVISIVLTLLIKTTAFTDSQVYALFLLFFATGLWLTEAIPPFAVSLLIIAFLVFAMGNPYLNSNPEPIDRFVNTFSSNIIWLFLGGFFISAAMTKTKIDEKILKFTLKISGTNPRNILIALMFTTMVGSMLMSNTATTAMIVAALMPLLSSLGKSNISKALLLGVSIAATTGGVGTIIGSPPNAVAAGIMESKGIGIDFVTWMLYGIPIAVTLTSFSCWVLIKMYLKDSSPVSLAFMNVTSYEKDRESQTQQYIVIIVITVTVLLWLTSSLHGIKVGAVSAIPIVFLTLTGILTGDDVKTLPWDTLLLVAGSLSLGIALEYTGILTYFATQLKTLNVSDLVFIFILAYISSIFANIMSNVGASAVLIPFGMAIIPGVEKELALSIGLSASMALILIVSAPPNAIVFSTGYLDQRDFRPGGLIIGLLGPALVVLWVLLIG